ncbi:hypothetical protein [Mycetocola sp. 2940]|uniref:hypothetical protein n=1 Tax=Mycetocola sp. 2940 TaxID=3156452 RepID=UPI0033921919
MTLRSIVGAMVRRWYVPLTILACVAIAAVLMARDGGIYTTRTVITFLRSAGTSLSPDNGADDASIIAFAAAVVLEANDGRPPEGYSLADAPYYGAGIREGTEVSLTNSGNQWYSSVSKAEIEIDIAGRSFAEVKSEQEETIDRILSASDSLQEIVGASPADRISASIVPLTTQIDYITPSRRTQFTAFAAMLAAAVLTAAWASVTVDGVLSKRRPNPNRDRRSIRGRPGEGVTP